MNRYVSEAVIRRLPGYYRHLRELEAEGVVQISSQEMGKRMNLTPSQIRQDINCFGGFGRQGYGYRVSDLKMHIGEILGLDRQHKMIIVGVGNIGTAVANYGDFQREGFQVIGMFDINPELIGTKLSDIEIRPVEEIKAFVTDNIIDMAVICVPVSAAQGTLDYLVECGIKAVWNFAPTDLKHDADVIVVNAHLSDSLQTLSYKIAHRE